LPTAANPIYQSPLDFDSEGDREVFMAGQAGHPTEKMIEEIAQEVEEELARAA
jgi:hypothetical protein